MAGVVTSTGIAVGAGAAFGSDITDPEVMTEIIVGSVGGELVEYGLKKSIAKMAMKRVAKVAGPAISKSVMKGIARQTVKNVAKKAAAKGVTSMMAKSATKAAGGPVGLALIAVDLISLGLDIADPWGFSDTLYQRDLDKQHRALLSNIKAAYEDIPVPHPFKKGETIKGRNLPVSMGGPITFPTEHFPAFPERDELGEFVDEKLNEKVVKYYIEYMTKNGIDLTSDPVGDDFIHKVRKMKLDSTGNKYSTIYLVLAVIGITVFSFAAFKMYTRK